jgi:hypothetical protein
VRHLSLSLFLSPLISLRFDLSDEQKVVQQLRVLIVESTCVRQVIPLEQLADCVEPQGLIQYALNGLLIEEGFSLSL